MFSVLFHSVSWMCIYIYIYIKLSKAFLISSIHNFKFGYKFYYLHFCLHPIEMHLKRTSCNLACVAVYRCLCWYYLVWCQQGRTDLAPLIATSTSLYLLWFQTIYVCVDLHFGVLCLKCVDCRTQIWPLPTSGLTAAKLKLRSWQWLTTINTYATLHLASYGKWWIPEWKVHT